MEGTYNKEKVKGWMNRLKTVYNRGFWDGYYLGQKWESGRKFMDLKLQKENLSRQGQKYFAKIQVAEFDLETQKLKEGDNILITGRTTGIIETIAGEIRINDKRVEDVNKGDKFSMKLNHKVHPNDKLYKVTNIQ